MLGDVASGDHGRLFDVAEEGDLLARISRGTARSERQRRMSGWMPMESISLTESAGWAWSSNSCAAANPGGST